MTILHHALAQTRGVDPLTYDPPVDIAEAAEEALRTMPEGVTSWLDKACEGYREPLKVRGIDTSAMSIPQLVSLWFNGDNRQVIAATHALRERFDIEFSQEKRDEVERQLMRAGLLVKRGRFEE
jgi:hypothetical protein